MNIDWLLNEFRGDRIEGYQLLDEKWENLDDPTSMARFAFNAEKTDPDTGQKVKDRCQHHTGDHHVYHVNFGGSDFQGISIAFSRCGSYSDFAGGFGPQVFMGVAKAINKYAEVRKPVAFSWSPVGRSTRQKAGQAQTPEARKNLYERMAVGNMFPEKYVSIAENSWLRRDLYDQHYVPAGFPKVPEDMTSNSHNKAKKAAVDEMRSKADQLDYSARTAAERSYSRERERLEREQRDRLEQEAAERLRVYIDDPQYNPNRLKLQDIAFLPHNPSDEQKRLLQNFTGSQHYQAYIINGLDEGKIVSFKLRNYVANNSILTATIRLRSNENESDYNGRELEIPVQILEKYDSSQLEARKRSREEEIDKITRQSNINPNGFKVGDKVVLMMPVNKRMRSSHQSVGMAFGAVGKITSRQIDVGYGRPSLSFKIKFDSNVIPESERDDGDAHNFAFDYHDDEITLNAQSSFLKPYTDDNVSEVKEMYAKHKNQLKDALQDIRLNPEQLQVNDEFFIFPNAVAKVARQNYQESELGFGEVYKIISVSLTNWTHDNKLVFQVEKQNKNVVVDLQNIPEHEQDDFVSHGAPTKFNADSLFIKKLSSERIAQAKNIYKQHKDAKQSFLANSTTNPFGLELGKKYIIMPANDANRYSSRDGFVGNLVDVVQNGRQTSGLDAYDFIFKKDTSKSLVAMSGSVVRFRNSQFDSSNKPVPYSDENHMKVMKLLKKRHIDQETANYRREIDKNTPQQEKYARRSRNQALMNDQRNPQGIGVGDKVKVKPENELPPGARIGWRVDRSREYEVQSISVGYVYGSSTNEIFVVTKPGGFNINVQYLNLTKSFHTPQLQKKMDKISRLRTLHQSETGHNDRKVGEEVVITGGPNRNKTGHIIGWKMSGNSMVAQVLLDHEGTEDVISSTYPNKVVSVQVRYLRPVAANASGVSELRPESMSYMNYLFMGNSYFEYKK